MQHILFGRSGLRVSELCLGTMLFGDTKSGRPASDPAESRTIFDAFAEAGGTFIDTAEGYAFHEAERLVGEFIRTDRDHFVLATKYSNGRSGITKSGNSRKNMMRAVESSLKRMGIEHIDLYYLHIWDYTTPIDEIMRGLDDLVRSGKILYAAISDAPVWEISRANMFADLRGWTPFVGIQINYNLVQRTPERELLPMARALDLGVTVWSPLAGGVLSGRYGAASGQESPRRRSAADTPAAEIQVGDLVAEIARSHDVSGAQVALAWLRSRMQYGTMIPVLGARTRAQMLDLLKCRDVTLEADELKRLNDATRIEMGFPHNLLGAESAQNLVHGFEPDRLIQHRFRFD